MSEYVPTKSDIAVAYRLVELGHVIHPDDVMDKRDMQEVDAEFDRWLASVKAGALRDAADRVSDFSGDFIAYEIERQLRTRADQIEEATP